MIRLALFALMLAVAGCADRASERHIAAFTLVQNAAAPAGTVPGAQ